MRLKRQDSGFTIVELVIVIVVIAILATISSFATVRYLQDARDAKRKSDVTVITEALEKYYEKNGEYPNCTQMTQPAGGASSLLGVDSDVFSSPGGNSDNTITCEALTGLEDSYSYVGDSCQGTEQCLGWTMQYRQESDGSIVTLKSRHNALIASSGATQLTVAPQSASQINLSWTAVPNATGYRVERSVVSSMASPTTLTTQDRTLNVTGLVSGERYYFRVTPYLGSDMGAPATGDGVTSISAPTGMPVPLIVISGAGQDKIKVSASGASCATGTTLQYALGVSGGRTKTTDSSGVTYSNWGTATEQETDAAQGNNYVSKVKARCAGSDAMSGEVVSVNSSNVTRPILPPSSPVYSGDVTWSAGYRYLMEYNKFTTYCPAGTWVTDDTIGLYRKGQISRYPTEGYYNTTKTVSDTYVRYLGWAQTPSEIEEQVTYYASYSCKTDFAASNRSSETGGAIGVTVTCEPGRRNAYATPSCDNKGADPATLPLGP